MAKYLFCMLIGRDEMGEDGVGGMEKVHTIYIY